MVPASALWDQIASAAWQCADPGVQYDTTINQWHTCAGSGRINASNPCSEYMFLDDSACNLASLNLMKFRGEDGSFDIKRFLHAVRVFIIAQEILVDNASYPTEPICLNSHRFRALGLGYANLGCLIMSLGLPYDSEAGRTLAGALTALMTGQAYVVSAELARVQGAFEGFAENQSPMLGVIRQHRSALDGIDPELCRSELLSSARTAWDKAVNLGTRHGFRNAQVTVLAPTGTIGFLMDCDTTGVEPDIALVKYKLLAGGGNLKIVNRTVPMALQVLGYNPAQIRQIDDYVQAEETIEGAPHLREEHYPVFDCAFKPAKGKRSIGYMAHLKMMSAVQSFLSGAISKTINMPNEITVDEITSTYIEGWKLGLKAVAIYRDGSKRSQPLSTSSNNVGSSSDKKQRFQGRGSGRSRAEDRAFFDVRPRRKRLPATRQSLTHKFDVAGHEGYLTVGLYENGKPGELFIIMAKEGSTVGGMMDAFGTAISMALQYGVPLQTLVDKFSHQRFEPSGITANRDIPFAKSIVDYIFRWLAMEFIAGYRQGHAPQRSGQTVAPAPAKVETKTVLIPAAPALSDAKPAAEPAGSASRLAGSSGTSKGEDGGNGGHGKDKSKKTPELLTKQVQAGLALASPVPPEALPVALADRYQHLAMLQKEHKRFHSDAPACDNCGAITVPNGRCYRCYNCGSSMGCS